MFKLRRGEDFAVLSLILYMIPGMTYLKPGEFKEYKIKISIDPMENAKFRTRRN